MEIDPSAPGTLIRVAFATEATLNLIVSFQMIFDPHSQLHNLGTEIMQASPSAEAAFIMQWVGVNLLVMTVGLLLGIPNKTGAVEIRRAVYIMLAALELMWLSVIAWQVRVLGEEASGFSNKRVIQNMAMPMVPFLLFRCWVLLAKPEWLGKYIAKRAD